MPNTEFDLPTDADIEEISTGAPKPLRDAYNKLAGQVRDLLAQNETLAAKARTVDIGAAFTAAGVDQKYARFYTGDLTKDAVAAWAADNADVFGITPVDADASSDDPAPLTPDQQTAARVAAAAAQGGSPEAKDLLAQLEGLLNDPNGYQKAVDLGLIQSAY